MKKLLFCILSLIQAVSMHAMGLKKVDEAPPKTGIVHNRLLFAAANNVQNQQIPDNDNDNNRIIEPDTDSTSSEYHSAHSTDNQITDDQNPFITDSTNDVTTTTNNNNNNNDIAESSEQGARRMEREKREQERQARESNTSLKLEFIYQSSSSNSSFVHVESNNNDDDSNNNNNNNNNDDDWDEVSPNETKEAVYIWRAEETIKKMIALLPANLQPYMKITNLHDSAHPIADAIKEIENARELLWLYMTRSDDNFAESQQKTFTANLEPCGDFDPQNVYPTLGYTNQNAKNTPNEIFAKSIAEKLEHAKQANDEKGAKLMRQFGYIFRNEINKQAFDAYLSGTEALESLKISENERDALQECLENILEVKNELSKLLQKQK